MHCGACGAENASGARFCSNCGAVLTERCPACGAVLPAEARFCPACGHPKSAASATEESTTAKIPGDERKLVTILFADFSGYTAFSARLDAEEVRDRMVSIWGRLDAIIKGHGGTTEKHIGDAIMAVFGAGQAREEDPEQAVRTALEIQSCLARHATGESPGWPDLQMRIGIHTGWVVLGPLGGTGESAPTGDTVNLASRLQESAPDGGVLISHDTYRHVYGLFDVQSQPLLTVKGKSEPIQTYLVLRARTRSLARTLRGVEGAGTEM